jgi:hypothetical protein
VSPKQFGGKERADIKTIATVETILKLAFILFSSIKNIGLTPGITRRDEPQN